MKMEQFIWIGILLIFVGFTIILFGALRNQNDSNTKVAVGGFIGFIPFGFGNDKQMVWFVTIMSVILFVLWFIFSLRMGK